MGYDDVVIASVFAAIITATLYVAYVILRWRRCDKCHTSFHVNDLSARLKEERVFTDADLIQYTHDAVEQTAQKQIWTHGIEYAECPRCETFSIECDTTWQRYDAIGYPFATRCCNTCNGTGSCVTEASLSAVAIRKLNGERVCASDAVRGCNRCEGRGWVKYTR